MASGYSQNLGIELINPGEQFGAWGATTNNNIKNLESAIAGLGEVVFQFNADLTLSLTNEAAANVQVARSLILKLTSTISLTTTRNLILPQITKNYILWNQTLGGQSIYVRTTYGTGVVVPNGARIPVFMDGINIYTQTNYLSDLTVENMNVKTYRSVGNITHYPAASSISLLDEGNQAVVEGGVLVGQVPNISITSLWITEGITKEVRFTGNVRLVNSSYLILPSSGNLDVEPEDIVWFRGEAGGVIRCIQYTRKSGNMTSGAALLANTEIPQVMEGRTRSITHTAGGRVREWSGVSPNGTGDIEYGWSYNCDLNNAFDTWLGRDVLDICWLEKWSATGISKEIWYAASAASGVVPVWKKLWSVDSTLGHFINGATISTPKNSGGRELYTVGNVVSLGSSSPIVVGTLKVTLPTAGTDALITIRMTGYDFSGASWDLTVAGQLHNSNQWKLTSAQCNNTFIQTVRLAYDGTAMCILLNNTNFNWSYPQVVVKEITVVSASVASLYTTGWTLGFITSEAGISISSTPVINKSIAFGGYGRDDGSQPLALKGGMKQDLNANPLSRLLKSGARHIREYNDITDGGSHGITAGSVSELATTFNAHYIANPSEAITLIGTTIGSSNLVEFVGTDRISVGMKVTVLTPGLIPTDSYVIGVASNGIHITLSTTASQSGNHTFTFTQSWVKTGSTVINNLVIAMSNTVGLGAGMRVTGTGIPVNSYIVSINPNVSITLNNEATSTVASSPITCDRLWARDANSTGDHAWMRRLKESFEEETWVATLPSNGSLDFVWEFVPVPLGAIPPDLVTSVAGRQGVVVLTKADVGLTNAEDKSSATIRSELTSLNITTGLGFTPENPANRDVPYGYPTLDATGKINPSQFPSIAVTDTYVVNSQANMLAIAGAGVGDLAIRTDINKSFILTASPATTLGNWQEMLTPTDLVQSVNGKQGVIVLVPSDIGAANSIHAHAISDVTGLQTALDGKSSTAHVHSLSMLSDWPAVTALEVSYLAGVTSAIQTQLNNKSDNGHSHAIADVGGLQTTLSGLTPYGHTHIVADISGLQTALDAKAQLVHAHAISDVTGLQTALNNKIETALMGAANGVATLGADSKIPIAQLPALAISNTFVVASEVLQLALTAQTGDVAIRTDLNKSFILTNDFPSSFVNWQELLTPTDLVQSVNGQTGVVVLTAANVGALAIGAAKPISEITGLQTALDGKSAVGHVHNITDINFLQTSLDARADITHVSMGVVTATTTLTTGQNGLTLNVSAATVSYDITLPVLFLGMRYRFRGTDNGTYSVGLVFTGNLYLPDGTVQAAGTYTQTNLALSGNSMEIWSDGANVYVQAMGGQTIARPAVADNQAVVRSQLESLLFNPFLLMGA